MMRYYRISVKANLHANGFKDEVWPLFSESMLPRIGEAIKGSSGRCLKVVSIVHGEEVDQKRDISTRTVEIVLE